MEGKRNTSHMHIHSTDTANCYPEVLDPTGCQWGQRSPTEPKYLQIDKFKISFIFKNMSCYC